MKQIYLLLVITLSYSISAQTTAIPDHVFEQRLIALNIDSDGIVNGQIATADALNVTDLSIMSPDGNTIDWIYDLTGIEAFVNLQKLTVNFTMAEELEVNTLVNLKHLDCKDNLLNYLDVSHNLLLESLTISAGGDVMPLNSISEIDLSNNPNINELVATGINFINLKNDSNNSTMVIDIDAGTWGMDPEYINGHTCIEVDDPAAAQNGDYPYSEWNISHMNQSYNFTALCGLDTKSFATNNSISIYPNPTSDMLFFNSNTSVDKATLFDLSGRLVKEFPAVSNSQISVAGLAKGVYVIQMVSGNAVQTAKVVIE